MVQHIENKTEIIFFIVIYQLGINFAFKILADVGSAF